MLIYIKNSKNYEVIDDVMDISSKSNLGNCKLHSRKSQFTHLVCSFRNVATVRNIVQGFLLFLWLINKSDFNNFLPDHSRHYIE